MVEKSIFSKQVSKKTRAGNAINDKPLHSRNHAALSGLEIPEELSHSKGSSNFDSMSFGAQIAQGKVMSSKLD